MIVVVGERGTGKTARAIHWLKANPKGVLVVPDYRRVNEVYERIAKDPDLDQTFAYKLGNHVLAASDPDRLRGLSGPWAADNFEQFPRHLGDTIRGTWDLITINGTGELLP